MAFIERTTILGVRCDKPGCNTEHRTTTRILRNQFYGRDRTTKEAAQRGWSFWTGRSFRAYCPQHGPGRGTKLEQWDPITRRWIRGSS